MERTVFDITIVGSGIVGLATAYQFQRRFPDHSVCVIEKEAQIASHQTGRNSGVIHSGIYYQPGSLKAKLCTEGVRALIQFAEENRVPYELCGKIIVAANSKEKERLDEIFEKGKANGIPDLKLISSSEIKDLEPNVEGIFGIHSPKTGIISYSAVAQALKTQIINARGGIYTGCKLTGIRKFGAGFVLRTTRGDLQTRWFVNCAGLYADEVAELAGLKLNVRIIPFRGEYWLIQPEKRNVVRNLVYPVPTPNMPFLGAHFTRTIDGKLKVGPNAVLALGRESYMKNQVHIAESLDIFCDRRFWKMAFKCWRTGIFELYRALRKASFVHALQNLVPNITEQDLIEGPSGIRAQCIDQEGSLVDDFQIIEAPSAIHVLNVPSPAATACLTIADYIVNRAASSFSLSALKAQKDVHEQVHC